MNQFASLIKSALSTPKTRRQLLEITRLPERTLRYHLAILKGRGIVKETFVLDDMRKKLFTLRGESA